MSKKQRRWEYTNITLVEARSTALLDDLGEDGWEVAAIAFRNDDVLFVMLKRKLRGKRASRQPAALTPTEGEVTQQ